MTLHALTAIREKRSVFPLINKQAISGNVQGILENFNQIKGRNFNRSVIYRQVGRDDYHQPSRLESLFEYWASVSFRNIKRGELLVAEVNSWSDWRRSFEIEPYCTLQNFWQVEETVSALLSQVRTCHLAGDVYEERALLLEIRDKVDLMVRMTGVAEVPGEMRAK